MSVRMKDVLARAREELPMSRSRSGCGRAGTETVVDGTRAVLLWEPRRLVPTKPSRR
jgi:hypothetical protein